MTFRGKHFGLKLDKLRVQAKYEVMAQMARDAEISGGYLSKLLSGDEYNPSRAILRRLATVLAVRLIEDKSQIKSKSTRLYNDLEEARQRDMEEAGRE